MVCSRALSCTEHDECKMMEPLVRGPIYKDSPLTVRAPAQFFDCLTGSLITEPVRLRRSPCSTQGRTFDRRSLQEWFRKYPGVDPMTGEVMEGWSIISSDDEMAAKLNSWAEAHALNLDAITRAACAPKSPRTPPCTGDSMISSGSPCRFCGAGAVSPATSLGSSDSWDTSLEACGRSLSMPRSLRA